MCFGLGLFQRQMVSVKSGSYPKRGFLWGRHEIPVKGHFSLCFSFRSKKVRKIASASPRKATLTYSRAEQKMKLAGRILGG